jgi:putative transposase
MWRTRREKKERKTLKDTQDMLKNFKVEGKELVYSKALQMVNNQLWYKYQCSCH